MSDTGGAGAEGGGEPTPGPTSGTDQQQQATAEQHQQQQHQQQSAAAAAAAAAAYQQQAAAAAAAAGRYPPGANPYAQYYGYTAGGYYDPYQHHRQSGAWAHHAAAAAAQQQQQQQLQQQQQQAAAAAQAQQGQQQQQQQQQAAAGGGGSSSTSVPPPPPPASSTGASGGAAASSSPPQQRPGAYQSPYASTAAGPGSPSGGLGDRIHDTENSDGTITREEWVEVFVIRPPAPYEKHEPTVKEVTIAAPSKSNQQQVLKAYPRQRLSYTFPLTAVADAKKVRSKRDTEVVRLKKTILRRYLKEHGHEHAPREHPRAGDPYAAYGQQQGGGGGYDYAGYGTGGGGTYGGYGQGAGASYHHQQQQQQQAATATSGATEQSSLASSSNISSVKQQGPGQQQQQPPVPQAVGIRNRTEEERKQLHVCEDDQAEPEGAMLKKRGAAWRKACLGGDAPPDMDAAAKLLVGPLPISGVEAAAKRVQDAASLYTDAAARLKKAQEKKKGRKSQAGSGQGDEEGEGEEEGTGAGATTDDHEGLAAFASHMPVKAVDEDQWVQCDKCTKWRRLPHTVDIRKLPARWYCSMNKYRPEFANCDVPEEAYTSNAADALQLLDPAEVREKRRVKAWVKRLEKEEKFLSRNHPAQELLMSRDRGTTDWVQCCNPMCGKWRPLMRAMDGQAFHNKYNIGYPRTKLWFCWMNTWDDEKASCAAPQEGWLVPLRIQLTRSRSGRQTPPATEEAPPVQGSGKGRKRGGGRQPNPYQKQYFEPRAKKGYAAVLSGGAEGKKQKTAKS